MKKLYQFIYFSFPFQLVVMHFQKNTTLLGVWVFLGLLLSGGLARSFGVMYLFLDPEYLGQVSFWSFFFIGMGFGGFLMIWNITTYILNSFRFPFLASLNRPFLKYCINNSVLPFVFLLFYFAFFFKFQIKNEYATNLNIFSYIGGFSLGFSMMLGLVIAYFIYTNKSIFKFIKKRPAPAPNRPLPSRKNSYRLSEVTSWRVDYYWNEWFQFRLTRDVRHYQSEVLLKVFKQHHYNAFFFQFVSVLTLFILAFMMDNIYFRIPAGASILAFCTVVISLIAAFKYWFRSWRVLAFLFFLLSINFITSKISLYDNQAYGLNYNAKNATYNYNNFDSIASPNHFEMDTSATLQILENWKAKFKKGTKPKMFFLSASGGGLRATAWTTHVLQHLDSVSNGQVFKHTVLMTGASGGMLGSAYMRDVYWASQQETSVDLQDKRHFENMSKDLQNSVGFAIASNDIFIPWIPFEAEGYRYLKDRAYIFEKQLKENADGLLSKRLIDYQQAEAKAEIPMLFLTPVIVNDARRLVISPQRVSYMMKPINGFRDTSHIEADGIDFGRFFEKQNAYNMRLSSALRMSATYPYILPNVSLPTEPKVEAMDAGWRDNYGFDSALRFVNVFREWIKENTSEVIMIEIRGFKKKNDLEPNQQGVIDRIFNPFSAVGQMGEVQDYHQDDNISHLEDFLGKEHLKVLRIEYAPSQLSEHASMSWHLTTRERLDIRAAIRLKSNKKACKTVKECFMSN
ncbi:MAG: patatin-like phospholipase family protein [Saprospiraceae bacterium]